jgi:hypothetical protein
MASGRLTLALPPMYSDLQACSHVYVWCRCRCIPTSRSVGMLSCKHTVPSPLYSDLQTSHVCCCCRCIPISDHVLMYAATISISRSLSMFSPGLRPPPYLLLNALLRSVYVRCCRRCIPASKHLTYRCIPISDHVLMYAATISIFRSLTMFSPGLPLPPYLLLDALLRSYQCRSIWLQPNVPTLSDGVAFVRAYLPGDLSGRPPVCPWLQTAVTVRYIQRMCP